MSNAVSLARPGSLFIDGTWRTAGSGGTHTHVNATTGEPQAELALAGERDVHDAVEAARAAFPAWRDWKADARRDALLRLAALVKGAVAELAQMLTLETGAIARQAPMAPAFLAEFATYYAGWTEKIEGSVIPLYPQDGLDYVVPEPYGVVGALIPWNGPLTPIGMTVIPALAAGNCVVIKPPELAPFTSLRFAELCVEAGLPAGVVNVVPGGGEAGAALAGHPGVDKLSFTGGTATARQVLAGAAPNLTPALLELGGKSANVVFDDADMDKAVPFAAAMPMMRTGQACLIPTRLLVQRSIHDEVTKRVVALIEGMKVGSPYGGDTAVGPVISEGHCTRILSTVERAKSEEWGELLTGGERVGGDLRDGFFVTPAVFGNVDHASPLAQEEIFGPVLSVIPFDDEDEALELANDSQYGLSAYVWTSDVSRANRLARRIAAGNVCVNGFGMPANAPFGGVKASGFGRQGGRAGLDEFLRPKNVFIQL